MTQVPPVQVGFELQAVPFCEPPAHTPDAVVVWQMPSGPGSIFCFATTLSSSAGVVLMTPLGPDAMQSFDPVPFCVTVVSSPEAVVVSQTPSLPAVMAQSL